MTGSRTPDPLTELAAAQRLTPAEAADARALAAALRLAVPPAPLADADPDQASLLVDGGNAAEIAALSPASAAAVAAVARCLDDQPAQRRAAPVRRWWLGAAAAAAGSVLILSPLGPFRDPQHRAGPLPATEPVPLEARADGVGLSLAWHRVPGAERYDVIVYDHEGNLLARTTTTDTTARVSGVPHTEPGSLFWRVRARLDVGRWSESVLSEVVIAEPGR